MIKTIQHSFLMILKAMAGVLLRYGVTHQVFMEWSKKAFVLAALEKEEIRSKKQPNAAISIMTGLHRKEVKKILEGQNLDSSLKLLQTNRVLRVVQGWLKDVDFHKEGRPTAIPFEGENSFSELNRRYSGDMKPKAMLNEMEVNQMISIDSDKNIHLIATDFMPSGDEGKIEILGFDVSKLIETINSNIDLMPSQSLFQKKVYYDNVPIDKIDEFKSIVNQKGMELLVFLDHWLSEYDGAERNEADGGSSGVGVGVFYFDDLKKE